MSSRVTLILIGLLIYTTLIQCTTDHFKMYESIVRNNYRSFCEEGFFYHYKKPLTIKQVRESEKVCPQP